MLSWLLIFLINPKKVTFLCCFSKFNLVKHDKCWFLEMFKGNGTFLIRVEWYCSFDQKLCKLGTDVRRVFQKTLLKQILSKSYPWHFYELSKVPISPFFSGGTWKLFLNPLVQNFYRGLHKDTFINPNQKKVLHVQVALLWALKSANFPIF